MEKCGRPLGKFIVVCDGMKENLPSQMNTEGKGFSVQFGWLEGAAPEAKACIMGIIYRKEARVDGCLLNFCPWCGADIHWWPQKPPAILPDGIAKPPQSEK